MKKFTLLLIAMLLTGCSDVWLGEQKKEVVLEGDRIDIIQSDYDHEYDFIDENIVLNTDAEIPNLKRKWDVKISNKSKKYDFTVQPIVDKHIVYTFDGKGMVSSVNKITGKTNWQVLVSRPKEDLIGMSGGGVYVEDKIVFVSTAFGDLYALDIKNGGMIWKYVSVAPFISSPLVIDNRVFVVNSENELFALNKNDGSFVFKHKGTPKETSLLSSLQITGNDKIVIPTYNSGEIFSIDVKSGRQFWRDNLELIQKNNQINTISTISSSNKIFGDILIASGLGNQLVAINVNTGVRIWQHKIKLVKNPVLIGEYLYVLDDKNNLFAMSLNSGDLYWKKSLNDFLEKDRDDIQWSELSIYKNNLVVNNSLKKVFFVSAVDGSLVKKHKVKDFTSSKILIDNDNFYILNQENKLNLYK